MAPDYNSFVVSPTFSFSSCMLSACLRSLCACEMDRRALIYIKMTVMMTKVSPLFDTKMKPKLIQFSMQSARQMT